MPALVPVPRAGWLCRVVCRWALLLAGFAAVAPASAQVDGKCGQYLEPARRHSTIVVFVNGIWNDIAKACTSSQELARLIGSTAYSARYLTPVPDGYDYTYFYNVANTLDDINELRAQAALSDVALGIAGVTDPDPATMSSTQKATYQEALASLYRGLDGTTDPTMRRVRQIAVRLQTVLRPYLTSHRRVLVVAHSQGNFYIEAAHALLRAEGAANLDRLRVVGVASVAASTPSDTFISHSGDNMVFRAQALNTSWGALYGTTRYKPLPHTDTTRILPGAGDGVKQHSFVDVYLSDLYYSPSRGNQSFRLIVRDLVRSHFVANEPAVAPVPTSFNFERGLVARLTVRFNVDMAPTWGTRGDYVPLPGREGQWTDPRTFVVEFSSWVPGGTITLMTSYFRAASAAGGLSMAADVPFRFPSP